MKLSTRAVPQKSPAVGLGQTIERSETALPQTSLKRAGIASDQPVHKRARLQVEETGKQVDAVLPTVEDTQGDDLSPKDFHLIGESTNFAEPSQFHHEWTDSGLFEKYWTKSQKAREVLNEDPKNPPQNSMQKVGTVNITFKGNMVKAIMYIVKDTTKLNLPPTPRMRLRNPAHSAPSNRPILQYGPPNGSVPLLFTPASAIAPPASEAIQPKGLPPTPIPASVASPGLAASTLHQTASPSSPHRPPSVLAGPATQPSPATLSAHPKPTIFSERPVAQPPSVPSPGRQLHTPGQPPQTATKNVVNPGNRPQQPPNPASSPLPGPQRAAKPAQGANAQRPAGHDPLVALLAQTISQDPELKDLAKKIAARQANQGERAHFQKLTDQLNVEYRRDAGQQGPSADRLFVDGRTVKYFADEVWTILGIVLASNPNQKSADFRPPPKSDPLIVLFVKTALEDQRTKDLIRRIAESRSGYTDATDLKQILDRLHRGMKTIPQNPLHASQGRQLAAAPTPNGHLPNGQSKSSGGPAQTQPTPHALRSKGSPPLPKPDISAVIFDFGTGDRYRFPKYSILETQHGGLEIVVSFLIVRKGSTSEYEVNPELDYYEPFTIRICSQSSRNLEHLLRVVAPQEQARRYMDNVMDRMTRAEYLLMAMQLPRKDLEELGAGKHNSAAFDPQIYAQDGARSPPPGVSHHRDRRGQGRWVRRQEALQEAGEFSEKPSWKDPKPRGHQIPADFGAMEEKDLPSYVKENAAWLKICARLREHRAKRLSQEKSLRIVAKRTLRRRARSPLPGVSHHRDRRGQGRWVRRQEALREAGEFSEKPSWKDPKPRGHQIPADFGAMEEKDLPSYVKENAAWLKICARLREHKANRLTRSKH